MLKSENFGSNGDQFGRFDPKYLLLPEYVPFILFPAALPDPVKLPLQDVVFDAE